MKNKLYITYDKVARATFGALIRVGNDEVARRSFYDLLKDTNSPLANHQGDYCLLNVGEIDENTGIITPYDIPSTVADGQQWLDAETNK